MFFYSKVALTTKLSGCERPPVPALHVAPPQVDRHAERCSSRAASLLARFAAILLCCQTPQGPARERNEVYNRISLLRDSLIESKFKIKCILHHTDDDPSMTKLVISNRMVTLSRRAHPQLPWCGQLPPLERSALPLAVAIPSSATFLRRRKPMPSPKPMASTEISSLAAPCSGQAVCDSRGSSSPFPRSLEGL